MKKFTISILLFFSLLLASYITFAATPIENGVSHVGNAIKDTTEGTRNIVMNAGNTIGSGIKSGTNAVSESGEKAMNSMQNTTNSIIGTVDNNYTTARTAADVNVLGWYYGAQYEHRDFDNE